MATTEEMLQNHVLEAVPEQAELHEPAMTLAGLTAALRARERGVAGPAPRNMETPIAPDEIIGQLEPDVVAWEQGKGIAEYSAQALNKLLHRENAAPTPEVTRDIANRLTLTVRLAGHPDSGVGVQAVKKMTLNMPKGNIVHYFSEDFREEAADAAAASPEIQDRVHDYLSQPTLLKLASKSRDPITTTMRAMRKASEIAEDRTGYLQRIGIAEVDGRFVEGMTPYNLMNLAMFSPKGSDESLQQAAVNFSKVAKAYPELANSMPSYVVGRLLEKGSGSRSNKDRHVLRENERLWREFAAKAKALAHIEPDARAGVDYALRRIGSDGQDEHELARAINHSQRKARVMQDTADRSTKAALKELSPHAFGILSHEPKLRNSLREIATSEYLTSEEKAEYFADIETIGLLTDRLCQTLIVSTGNKLYPTGVRSALAGSAAKFTASILSLARGEPQKATITITDRIRHTVEVGDSKTVFAAAKLLIYTLEQLDAAHRGSFEEEYLADSHMSRFVSDTASVAIGIRPKQVNKAEARFSWTVYMPPEKQEAILGKVYDPKKSARVMLRLDKEAGSGAISMDIGGGFDIQGVTSIPNPLNQLIGSVITVTSQGMQRIHGENATHDYHVRHAFSGKGTDEATYQDFLSNYSRQLSQQSK